MIFPLWESFLKSLELIVPSFSSLLFCFYTLSAAFFPRWSFCDSVLWLVHGWHTRHPGPPLPFLRSELTLVHSGNSIPAETCSAQSLNLACGGPVCLWWARSGHPGSSGGAVFIAGLRGVAQCNFGEWMSIWIVKAKVWNCGPQSPQLPHSPPPPPTPSVINPSVLEFKIAPSDFDRNSPLQFENHQLKYKNAVFGVEEKDIQDKKKCIPLINCY